MSKEEFIDYITAVWLTVEDFVLFIATLIVIGVVLWSIVFSPILLIVVATCLVLYNLHKGIQKNLKKLKEERDRMNALQNLINTRERNE